MKGSVYLYVYYTSLRWNNDTIYIAATDRGVCFISAGDNGKEELDQFKRTYFSESKLIENNKKMEPFRKEVQNYLSGKQQSFRFPIDLYGTTFQKSVWKALLSIPYGEVKTYTDIAREINRPQAVRAVANAIGKNPLLFVVPCHRIVRKDNQLSGFRAGVALKRSLLQLEGVSINDSDIIVNYTD